MKKIVLILLFHSQIVLTFYSNERISMNLSQIYKAIHYENAHIEKSTQLMWMKSENTMRDIGQLILRQRNPTQLILVLSLSFGVSGLTISLLGLWWYLSGLLIVPKTFIGGLALSILKYSGLIIIGVGGVVILVSLVLLIVGLALKKKYADFYTPENNKTIYKEAKRTLATLTVIRF